MLILRCFFFSPSCALLRSTELEWTRKVSFLRKGGRFPATPSCSRSPREPVCAHCGETGSRRSCLSFATYPVYFKGPPGKHHNKALRRDEHFSPLLTLIVSVILAPRASFPIIHVQMRRLTNELKQPEY